MNITDKFTHSYSNSDFKTINNKFELDTKFIRKSFGMKNSFRKSVSASAIKRQPYPATAADNNNPSIADEFTPNNGTFSRLHIGD